VVAALVVVACSVMHGPLLQGGAYYERDIQSHWLPEGEGLVRAVRAGSYGVDPKHLLRAPASPSRTQVVIRRRG
jgi:hypothetical protein